MQDWQIAEASISMRNRKQCVSATSVTVGVWSVLFRAAVASTYFHVEVNVNIMLYSIVGSTYELSTGLSTLAWLPKIAWLRLSLHYRPLQQGYILVEFVQPNDCVYNGRTPAPWGGNMHAHGLLLHKVDVCCSAPVIKIHLSVGHAA